MSEAAIFVEEGYWEPFPPGAKQSFDISAFLGRNVFVAMNISLASSSCPRLQQFLYFFPLAHGHGRFDLTSPANWLDGIRRKT